MYVCCGVGCVRLSRCVWMRMVLDVDGEARCCRLVERMCIWMRMVLGVDGEARCCRLVGRMCIWMWMVLGVDGEARCCRLVEGMCIWMRMAKRVAVAWLRIFFIFCLRRGGGYMYS